MTRKSVTLPRSPSNVSLEYSIDLKKSNTEREDIPPTLDDIKPNNKNNNNNNTHNYLILDSKKINQNDNFNDKYEIKDILIGKGASSKVKVCLNKY